MPKFRLLSRLAALLAVLFLLSACGKAGPVTDPAKPGQTPGQTQGQVPGGQTQDPGQATGGNAEEEPVDAPAEEPPEVPMPEVAIEFIGGPVVAVDEADADRKFVMLTYDDGPNPGTTEAVLDALKAAKVKAVFFVTGYGVEHEDLLRRIHTEGHTIGTHTVSHPNLRNLTKEDQRAEIVPVNEVVERVTGQKVKYFRPPHGAYNQDTLDLMDELGLQLVNWTHGSRDWEPDVILGDPARVTAKVLAEEPADSGDTALWPGAVVLLHDTLPWTAAASPDFIAGLQELGYEFVILR